MKLITIWFGANDASDPKLNARQPVPVEQYTQNLKDMINYIRRIYDGQNQPHIVLITPPALDQDAFLITFRTRTENPSAPFPDRRPELVEPYVEAVIKVAKELQVPYLDLFHEMQKSPDWKKYLMDGLHLSSDGNRFVFTHLVELITSNFPELNPQNGMVMDFIDNKLIDLKNPKESLKRRNY